MKLCSINGCSNKVNARGWCGTHLSRWYRHGDPLAGGTRTANGTGHARRDGRTILVVDGKKRQAHVLIAERVLGRPLPPKAEVHHIDEDPSNNAPFNLVICPDAAYHKLLHQRQRAFDACGRYDWRKCKFCQSYDAPENLYVTRKVAFHRACSAAAKRAQKAARKQQHQPSQGVLNVLA